MLKKDRNQRFSKFLKYGLSERDILIEKHKWSTEYELLFKDWIRDLFLAWENKAPNKSLQRHRKIPLSGHLPPTCLIFSPIQRHKENGKEGFFIVSPSDPVEAWIPRKHGPDFLFCSFNIHSVMEYHCNKCKKVFASFYISPKCPYCRGGGKELPGEERMFIEVFPQTRKDDIVENWDIIKTYQTGTFGKTKRHKEEDGDWIKRLWHYVDNKFFGLTPQMIAKKEICRNPKLLSKTIARADAKNETLSEQDAFRFFVQSIRKDISRFANQIK